MTCLSTEAAISPKPVKIEEKLLWSARLRTSNLAGNIQRVHPNKRPLKIKVKGSVGEHRPCTNFF